MMGKGDETHHLRDEQSELKHFINQAPVAIFIFRGEELVIETANERALEMISRTEQVIGKPLLDALPELKGSPAIDVFLEVYHTGVTQYGIEILVPLEKDGKLQDRYFNFTYTPLTEDGKVVGIMDVATEVTDQVNARKQIEESEIRFRSIVEGSSVATALYTGKEIWITYVNDIMLGYWGKERSITGKRFREALPELEGQPFPDLLDQVFATGVPYQSRDAESFLMVDGKLKQGFFNFTFKPLFDSQGQVWAIHHMAVDVTDQVLSQRKLSQSEARLQEMVTERTNELLQANESMAAMNQELRRSNAKLEEFVHAASHDLKEPIRKIHFFTNKLKSQLEEHLSESGRDSLRRIEKSTQRMANLIDDLLLYSHVSHQPHETESVDLASLIAEVMDDLEVNIAEKSAVIHVSGMPVVQGHGRQLAQLFENLLSNAIKYSASGRQTIISIMATKEQINDRLFHIIHVNDNGIGFPQEYADKIFQMFQRLHGKDEYTGTGVGLSIVKKIAENHHGFVRASSVKGEGASFHVYLPA